MQNGLGPVRGLAREPPIPVWDKGHRDSCHLAQTENKILVKTDVQNSKNRTTCKETGVTISVTLLGNASETMGA